MNLKYIGFFEEYVGPEWLKSEFDRINTKTPLKGIGNHFSNYHPWGHYMYELRYLVHRADIEGRSTLLMGRYHHILSNAGMLLARNIGSIPDRNDAINRLRHPDQFYDFIWELEVKTMLEINGASVRVIAPSPGVSYDSESPMRFETVKKRFPTAHIDKAAGSSRSNRDYIRKEGKWADTDKADTRVEGSFKEFGTIPDESEEKAPRMAQLMKHIQDGLSNVEILQIDPSYGFKIREMDQLRQQLLNDKYIRENRKVTVHYIYGDSGTGKTRSIFEKHPATDICRITSYPPRGNVLFDSYKGQPVLVFEEFHSQISISDMLNFLDIYPVMLPARYYDRVACYTEVYITSNIPLEEQYPEIQKCKFETWKAFLRRIHTVTEFRKGGIIREVKNEEPE